MICDSVNYFRTSTNRFVRATSRSASGTYTGSKAAQFVWKTLKTSKAFGNPEDAADGESVCEFARGLDPSNDEYAAAVIERVLSAGIASGASDIHLDAIPSGTLIRWRVDGSLVDMGWVPAGKNTSLVNRLKALANLLTYRTDIPQEGRLVRPASRAGRNSITEAPEAAHDALHHPSIEARVVTLPTLHGERLVIRLAAQPGKSWMPSDLGLPIEIHDRLARSLRVASGAILVTGPAGSGKTTTAYACLRAIAAEQASKRSIVTLEDPIEVAIPGVAQSQIQPSVGYDWASGLRALLRQDPEVMLVGEIRDAETAQVVFQAAMTGQLVFSTMHARGACDAVSRVLDMKVPAHQMCSSLNLLLCQRLVRRLCSCRQPVAERVDADNSTTRVCDKQPYAALGCEACGQTGYRGRLLLAEALPSIEDRLARAIADRADTQCIKTLADELGMISFVQQIDQAISSGLTTNAEIERHFVPV